MVQTDLLSDNLCGFNQSGGSMHWILDPIQNNVQYNVGEVGNPTGVGLHTPSEVIGVSSMIVGGGRDNLLTKCLPPVQSLPSKLGYASDDSIKNGETPLEVIGSDSKYLSSIDPTKISDRNNELEKFQVEKFTQEHTQKNNHENYNNYLAEADGKTVQRNENITQFLTSNTTRLKGAAKDLSAIDFKGGFAGSGINLYSEPQNLTNVIERMWLQRGGVNSNQLIKQSYEPWASSSNICQKIRQPYSTNNPFGIPPNDKLERSSTNFTANDIATLGLDSPQYGNPNNLPFNENAPYFNGGNNSASLISNYKNILNSSH